ncbi:LLM class F420-dependent oxidoreductase [Rhodococcus sp. 06-462-5]|uniref:LLM class F420-dependent oxidoreductase n=1 Tax=Nocardiaceae TaxID=85025 RepID=UPI00050BDB75|nr:MULTISPECIES: LLM class F420-dependent oxidoreductase [Rhodococcus]OZC74015.1 LLM class F420-dependent oxidoreductase [Rhodococcus sp. 06-462-5]OZE68011.1 LLM class F420-dependent oxidoreductase [Rhodococcus sp. 02-925g]OZF51967.1 LLM class F420-dependent oxidoreductase [Rhodococcus sp. 14-1411-2a]
MRVGVVFPQTELGGDPGAIRAYGQRVEELGYRHIVAYDHVVGADPAVHTGWNRAYDVHTTFSEPLVLFGYLAALTRRVELVTGVIILPQRQTVLVAKQAAEVDLLSGGRLRLGVGVGWNAIEFEALGENFTNRGARTDEQIAVLRTLWCEQSVSFDGTYHRITGAGIAPLPVQRPIPIWIGAASAPGFRRAGRTADGWFPLVEPGPELDDAKAVVAEAAVGAGRDPASIGMEGRIIYTGDIDAVARALSAWKEAGASHVSISTMDAGLATVDEHLDVLASIAELSA